MRLHRANTKEPLRADRAAIETAQLQLDWCTIQSPISGKIGLRLVDPGNIITANTPIWSSQPISAYRRFLYPP